MNDVMKQNPDLVKNMMDAVQNTTRNPAGPPPEPTIDPNTGRREMAGPGFDISSLMGGIGMPPPPPMNTTQLKPVKEVAEEEDDDLSDIVSISGESTGGELKDVSIKGGKGRGRGRKKKNEVTI